MPHPAAFALYKLLIAPRRQGRTGKQAQDLDAAVAVLEALRTHGEIALVKNHLASMLQRWQARIRQVLGTRQELRDWRDLLYSSLLRFWRFTPRPELG